MSYHIDVTKFWPKCAICGKGAREGKHATDLGFGHDYVPATNEGLKERKGRLEEYIRR